METKRVFFGLEVAAPWPEELPAGRMLLPEDRHFTLAFLGNIPFDPLEKLLPHLPRPPSLVGSGGVFDQCLFLPKRRPNVVAWKGRFLDPTYEIGSYQQELTEWLWKKELLPFKEERDFLPHVTLCRKPFDSKQWQKAFFPVPFITKSLHLYESLGHSRYKKIWTHVLIAPFIEISHTADVAFSVAGQTLEEIAFHAQLALAFTDPAFVPYIEKPVFVSSLDDVIIDLNRRVSLADEERGIGLKAVSYSGVVAAGEDGVLTWEMIVDV